MQMMCVTVCAVEEMTPSVVYTESLCVCGCWASYRWKHEPFDKQETMDGAQRVLSVITARAAVGCFQVSKVQF